MNMPIFRAALSTAALLVLASCEPAPQLRVHDAVLTLSPVDSNPSSLHFKVLGGPRDVYLLAVGSPSVIRAEMHDIGVDPKTGAVTMKPLDRVLIPADGVVEFKRGGKHVMMWGVNLVPRRLGIMETEFVFNSGDRIQVKAVVQEADGSEPDEKKALN
jgi:periplasmic copper chaperone A